MAVKTVPKRSEIPEELTWNLKDIFADDEAWLAEYEALKSELPKISGFAGTLGESAERMLEYFKMQDEISVRVQALYGYAECISDQNTANGRYQDFKGKAISIYSAAAQADAFAAPEIMAIPEETLAKFFEQEPALEEYRRSIFMIRRMAEHILTPKEEALLAAAGEMSESASGIAGTLRNADMRYPNVTDGNGTEHPLTDSTLVPLMESPDRTLRENAFKAYYKTLGGFRNTLAASLDGQFKQLRFFADARKYPNTLEAALYSHEVPVSVYHNLISAVHDALPSMYRYVALRRRALGVPQLHMYDVYTPIVPDSAVQYTYDEAKSTVLEALSVLGEDYIALLQRGFNERWIDVLENEGKRSGAYSSGFGRPHPYVLLNFNGNLDSVFTLAHEMGHTLHTCYSTAAQPISCSDYVIFVAEVASTVNEVLLMKHLLGKTTDASQRAYLLNHFLDSFKGTVFRQTMFAEFELQMGRMSESGDTLTADSLCEKYHALNKLYFGPEMVSDDEIALEWARIPHFFYDYYVFQYATGYSAAVAIAERILNEGAPAVADYKKFLSGGGSTDPVSLLKIAGVDMSTPEPVSKGLKLFDELVTELEALI